MAFFSKVGSILRQSATKRLNREMSLSCPSMYQAIRCMSSSKVFIGGLSYTTDDQSLREAFGSYGEVVEARVIMDRETGRSRGFGFITYTSSEEASSAIQALDGQDLHGRRVRVNYATDRARGGGFGGGGGNYGGGEGNYGGGGGNYGGGGGNYGGGGGNYGGGGGNYGGGGGNYGGGGGNYGGGNYGGGGGGYNNGGSYGGTGGGGGYSGNYPSGGYSGGNNFDSGTATYGSGGENNFNNGSGAFGSSGGVSGVPSGSVSSDNYVSGGENNFNNGSGAFGSSGGVSGVPSGSVSSDNYASGGVNNGFARVNQFDTPGSGGMADVAEGEFNPVEENSRDGDDEPDNIAKNV